VAGDEHKQMLQRIYGTSWPSEEMLQQYLHNLEAQAITACWAANWSCSRLTNGGTGLVLWHPKGAMVRYLIESFWREEHLRRGYDMYTPHVGRIQLWETSGHRLDGKYVCRHGDGRTGLHGQANGALPYPGVPVEAAQLP
jgi:threonyl-tRNA synthetase